MAQSAQSTSQPVQPSPRDLAGAEFSRIGSTLTVTAAGGEIFVVPGYFPGGDGGLPDGLNPDAVTELDAETFTQIMQQAGEAAQQRLAALSDDDVENLLDEIAENGEDQPPEDVDTAAGEPQNNGPNSNFENPGGLDAGNRYGPGDSGDGPLPSTRGGENSFAGGEDISLLGGGGGGGIDIDPPQLLSALSFSGPDALLGTSQLAALAPVTSEFAGGTDKNNPEVPSNVVLRIELDGATSYDFDTLRDEIENFTNPPAPPPKFPPEGEAAPDADPGSQPADGVPPDTIEFVINQTHDEIGIPFGPYITFTGTPTTTPYSAYVPSDYLTTYVEDIPARLLVENVSRAHNWDDNEPFDHSLQFHFYLPDHRHGVASNIVVNTNLTIFTMADEDRTDDFRAFPSVAFDAGAPETAIDNSPDVLAYDGGILDTDWLGFYDRADPYAENGNYTLTHVSSYSKFLNIDVLDASSFIAADGYGANDVKLNVDAVRSMTEVVAQDSGPPPGPDDPPDPEFIFQKLVVLGDSADTVSLADESDWSYGGIIDAGELEVARFVFDEDTGEYIFTNTATTVATRDEFGTALYEFQYVGDDGTTTLLWISDDFGDHPDFYWTGTEDNDTAEFPDTEFAAVDALGGFDTLFMNNAEATLVESFVGVGGIANFEALSLRDNDSDDDITLDHDFVAAATDADNYLFVYGDPGDSLNFAPGDDWWLAGRLQDTAAGDTYIYQSPGGAESVTVYADVELSVTGAGIVPATDGGDNLFVNDLEFGALDGLDGFDRLGFLQSGEIDLTDLAPGNSVASIEIFDLTNGESNDLVFDALTMDLFGASELYIVGDETGDSLTLSDAGQWAQGPTFAAGDYNLINFSTVENGNSLVLWVDENLV